MNIQNQIRRWSGLALVAWIGTACLGASGCPAPNTPSTSTPVVITNVMPLAGNPGVPVTLVGSGFTGTTSVTFAGIQAPFVVNSDTQISTQVPNGTNATGVVQVSTPYMSGSSASQFAITNLAPVITSISSGKVEGAPGSTAVIAGANFTGASQVSFMGTNATYTVDSDSQITAMVPSSNGTLGGITVTGPYGNSYQGFTIDPNNSGLLPVLMALSATSGAPGTNVDITGASLDAASLGSVVSFNGTPAKIVSSSNAKMTVTVPAGATSGPILIQDVAGGVVSSGVNFMVTGTAPVISSFAPISGTAGTTVVSIHGQNLLGATVKFNGKATSGATVTSSLITVKVPSGATTGAIQVTTTGGTANSLPFLVGTPGLPKISAITPASAAPGSTIRITGSGFTGATAVVMGLISVTYSVDSDTQITAIVPAGVSGLSTIQVTTPKGPAIGASPVASPVANNGLMVQVYGLSLTTASVGYFVKVAGTQFLTGVNFVTVGGVPASYTVNSDQQLTLTVPAGAQTGQVEVGTFLGTASSGVTLTIQ